LIGSNHNKTIIVYKHLDDLQEHNLYQNLQYQLVPNDHQAIDELDHHYRLRIDNNQEIMFN
jgi:hypothetical protein